MFGSACLLTAPTQKERLDSAIPKADSSTFDHTIYVALFGTQDLQSDIEGGLDGKDFFSILEKVIVPELDVPGTYFQ